MPMQNPYACCGITRRGFLLGSAVGLAAGVPLGWLALKATQRWGTQGPSPFTGRSVELPTAVGMPGPFAGRVVEIRHPDSVTDDYRIDAGTVRTMMHQGMRSLTGSDDVQMAWRRFFEHDDVVGIKVNPVGKAGGGHQGSISSPEVLR